MKRVNLPLLGSELKIYKADEREDFAKVCDGIASDYYGCCYGPNVWIGQEKGKRVEGIIAHELTHFVDWLLETRLDMKPQPLDSTGELRAYIVQFLFPIVLDYVKGDESKN